MKPLPPHVTIRRVFIALAVLLMAAAPVQAGKSAYNLGVEAWRAKDYAEARRQWQRSLGEGGPDEALNNLAFLLYHGLGGEAEPAKAVELWRKGAALGVSEAQWHLGQAYEAGRGIGRNPVRAYAWYACAVATASKPDQGSESAEREILRQATESLSKLDRTLSADERKQALQLAAELKARYSTRLSIERP